MKWRPKSFFMGFDLLELLLIYLFMAMPFDSSRSQFTIYIYIYIYKILLFSSVIFFP